MFFSCKFDISAVYARKFKIAAVEHGIFPYFRKTPVMLHKRGFCPVIPHHGIAAERIAKPFHTAFIAVIDAREAVNGILDCRYHTKPRQSATAFIGVEPHLRAFGVGKSPGTPCFFRCAEQGKYALGVMRADYIHQHVRCGTRI